MSNLVTEPIVDPAVVIPPVPAPVSSPVVGQGETVFTKADVEAAVEKARQQEKDKLYGKVDNLEKRLTEIAESETTRVQAEETARLAAEEVARKASEEELSAKDLLAQRTTEWQDRLTQTEQSFAQKLAEMTKQREEADALLAKEQQFNGLQAYKAQRLVEESETIAPQFHQFITGNTQDEIEQSLAIAKEKSAEIAAEVQAAMGAAPRMRGTSVTGYAPVSPVEFESGERRFSAEDIQNMDMAEYAKHRAGLIGSSNANRGLFS